MDNIQTIVENSFSNFQALGVDYICLKRSKDITIKAYFFEGVTSEVVVPHNHRYDFTSIVMWGSVVNREYIQETIDPKAKKYDPIGRVYASFDFLTPLNGGFGFQFREMTRLELLSQSHYKAGQAYHNPYDVIHTLEIASDRAVLLQYQYEDVMPIQTPSQAFVEGGDREPPSLDGRYDPMTESHVIRRLGQLQAMGMVGLEFE